MVKNGNEKVKLVFTAGFQKKSEITIIKIPKKISSGFSTRGMVLAEAEIDGVVFTAELEPDGEGGHLLAAGGPLHEKLKGSTAGRLKVILRLLDEWPDPKLPVELKRKIDADAGISRVWENVTAKAKWEWVRWIRAAKADETRRKRIKTACSMLKAGKKRPCCFNSRQCTLPGF